MAKKNKNSKKGQATVSRFQKRKTAKKPTLADTILSYRIWTIAVGGWLGILAFLLIGWGIFYFVILYEYQNSPVVETFVAEVDDVWTEQRETYGGGTRSYYAKLVHDDNEVTCRIPSRFAPDIVPKRSYEFEISRSRTKCVITEAEDVTLFDLKE